MTTLNKKIYTHAGIVMLMIVVACAYFMPILQGKALPQGDIQKSAAMGYEQTEYANATGEEIPNWNPAMFGGMPGYQTAVEAQHSVFTPLKSLLIMRPLGLERNIGVLFLYLLGFYVALLAFGCTPWLSLLGALAFALGSYNIIIIEAGHITKAWAMSMMAPIIGGMFLCLKGTKERQADRLRGLRNIVVGGVLFTLALGLQITFNHIQITFYTALIGIFLGVAYMIGAMKQGWFKPFLIGVGVLLVGCAMALACNARHLVVNQEYSKATMRGGSEITVTAEDLYNDGEAKSIASTTGGLERDYAFQWSYGVGETYTLLVPGAMGGGSVERVDKESASYTTFHQDRMPLYWGNQPFTSGPVYFGAIVVFLFVVGMMVVKGAERWWILAATVLAIMMSWGRNLMGLNEWLFNNLPLYNKFRTPSMSLVIANVTMVIMAVLCIKAILEAKSHEARKTVNRALYIGGGIVGGLILVVLMMSGGFAFSGLSDSQMAAQYGNQWAFIQNVFIQDRKALLVSDSWRSLIFILLALAVLWLYNNEKLKKQGVAIAALAVLTTVDLWGVDRRYLNDDNYVSNPRQLELKQDSWDYEIDQMAAVLGDKDYRCLNLAVNTFNDSKPSAYHHQVGGYSAAKLRRYQDLIDFYLSRHINPQVLNMLNTRYVVMQDGKVQRNLDALGNCWFVDEVKMVNNANEEILALNELNPATTAVVDGSQFALATTSFAGDSSDAIVCEHQNPYNPDYLKYTSKSKNDRLAVFSEIYYVADWKAYIDGKPADYLRANYVLRAMVIPSGNHTIEFRNEAPLLHKWDKITLICSIATVIVMAGALVMVFRKKRGTATQQK